MTSLPPLKEGLHYGEPFTRADLRPGQSFYKEGDRYVSTRSGTIKKVNRTTFIYEGQYFSHTLEIQSRPDTMNGAFILEGDTVHILQL